MLEKSKSSKQKKSPHIIMSQADKMLDLIGQQLLLGDYTGAVTSCERLLKFLPSHSPLRADTLAQLGTAYAMLQNYPQSYAAYTEAL